MTAHICSCNLLAGTVVDVIARMGVATIRLTPESASLPPPAGDGEENAFGKFELDLDYGVDDADAEGDGGGEGWENASRLGGAEEETVVVELSSLIDVRLVPPS